MQKKIETMVLGIGELSLDAISTWFPSKNKETIAQAIKTSEVIGLEKILKKVGEESTEVVISSLGDNKDNQVNEMCDLIYHLLVLMAELGISLEDIKEELEKRSKKINNFKGERKEIENI